MKPGTIGKSYQGPSLPQRYYTPAEAQIPALPGLQKHKPVSVILRYRQERITAESSSSSSNNKVSEESKGNELDGFFLLEASGAEFPENVKQLHATDHGLTSIVEDDMTFFSELIVADVSENFLRFESFGAFPVLQDLRIACNSIRQIGELHGFAWLMYLDLSYNQLDIASVSRLDGLDNLKEIDLSGNNLGGLPATMSSFKKLEKIVLDYNRIEDGSVFSALSTMSTLRHVGLANNFLSRIPSDFCVAGNMRVLEILDLAFNYFNSEDELEPLTTLPRLVTLMLYGNPVLGPTGEDPMYIYIENLVEVGYRNRDGSNTKDIDFVTEIPRRRVLKKGQQLGRQAAYRDFTITQVDTTVSSKSANEWKKIRTQTLFAEAVAATSTVKKSAVSAILAAANGSDDNAVLPDFTFITSNGENNDYSNRKSVGHADVIADNVMKQVAQEMGLLNSAELIYLRDKARLPPTAGKVDSLFHEDRLPITTLIQQTTAVPEEFYGQKTMTNNAAEIVAAQPIALQTAMRALHMAIQQPLTDYDEIYDSKLYTRPTKNSKSWQVPRKLASSAADNKNGNGNTATNTTAAPGTASHKGGVARRPSRGPPGTGNGTGTAKSNPSLTHRPGSPAHNHGNTHSHGGAEDKVDEDFPDKQRNKYKLPGLPEPVVSTQRRARNREHTLDRIDQVLDSLNTNTEAMTSSAPLLEMNARETVNKLKKFVKPYPAGIKNLMDMVDEVVNDFGK